MEDGTELIIHHDKNDTVLQADEIDINIGEKNVHIVQDNNTLKDTPKTNPSQNNEKDLTPPLEKSPLEDIPEATEPPSITDTNKKDYPLPTPKISEMTPPTPPLPSPDTVKPEEESTESDIPDLFKESDEESANKEVLSNDEEIEEPLPELGESEEIDEDIPEIEDIDTEGIDDSDEIEDAPDMPID